MRIFTFPRAGNRSRPKHSGSKWNTYKSASIWRLPISSRPRTYDNNAHKNPCENRVRSFFRFSFYAVYMYMYSSGFFFRFRPIVIILFSSRLSLRWTAKSSSRLWNLGISGCLGSGRLQVRKPRDGIRKRCRQFQIWHRSDPEVANYGKINLRSSVRAATACFSCGLEIGVRIAVRFACYNMHIAKCIFICVYVFLYCFLIFFLFK